MADVKTIWMRSPGYASEAVGRFLWELDEQRRLLTADTRGLGVDELQWQTARGMNSIGMLLAHIAFAEVHLVHVGLQGMKTSDVPSVIGLTEDQEGLPLAPDAPPSPALAGKDLAYFDDLLARTRALTHEIARGLGDSDLETEIHRTRPDGTRRVFNKGWVLYHLVEHEAGHRAQINLLRHLHRVTTASAVR